MKKVLIINLRRIGDVYTTGHLINSMANAENTSISMLVYKETENAAKNLKNISSLHAIDRKEIITLKSNKLFSDGFAFELLFRQIEIIKKQKWDEIINFSNDLVGAYLCSYLKNSARKIVGIHFNENRNIITNNNWELLFNDVLSTVKYAPVHFIDCYHKMVGVTHKTDGEKVITNSSHNTKALSNINMLRKNHTIGISSTKIVGIQIKTSDTAKDIPESIMIDLITLMREASELIPVILIAPFEDERQLAIDLNSKFNNELNIIEADLEAVSSVLMNLDILITPDTAIKHIADLTETPVLEISLGYAPFLKQGSYAAGSLILTDILIERNFNKSETKNQVQTNIKAVDIISSLLYFFAKTKSIRPRLSNDVTLYSCSFDKLGARYSVVAGSVNAQLEIHRLMTRQLINSLYDGNESSEIYSDVADFGTTAASTWCANEKTKLTEVTKDLLGTLRTLIQSQETKKGSREFINNLGKLISHSENFSIMQIPVMMFKTKIEAINSTTFEENVREVEVLLYELKTNVQKVLETIKNLDGMIGLMKKEEFSSKNGQAEIN
jgi:ADP-heptose:LPS heptosyltransferase